MLSTRLLLRLGEVTSLALGEPAEDICHLMLS
jgi:hypothetical protein